MATSTTASRCSKKASLISPVSALSATSGPAERVAFSVNRTAMVLPSGDHFGESRKPLTLVSFGGVGEKCEALAVRRPGWIAFGVIRSGSARGDTLRRRVALEIFHVDR